MERRARKPRCEVGQRFNVCHHLNVNDDCSSCLSNGVHYIYFALNLVARTVPPIAAIRSSRYGEKGTKAMLCGGSEYLS